MTVAKKRTGRAGIAWLDPALARGVAGYGPHVRERLDRMVREYLTVGRRGDPVREDIIFLLALVRAVLRDGPERTTRT